MTTSIAKKKAKILCVDDEEQVLHGLEMLLGRRYNVLTATGGEPALRILEKNDDIAVIISDMRMPAMDGAVFLRKARDQSPDSTRLLLTGQAELASAIKAINEGQVFRFLTKPCPPADLQEAIAEGVRQYRLVVGERELLEGTLQGSIQAMIDVLSMTNPLAFGRGTRVKVEAMKLANGLDMGQPWELNVAAMLMDLGCITLPEALLEKMHHGKTLDADEQQQRQKAYGLTESILANIPRLEVSRAIVGLVTRDAIPSDIVLTDEQGADVQKLARVLRAAVQYDQLEATGTDPKLAVEMMESTGKYTEVMVEALADLHTADGKHARLHELPPAALEAGMVLADDLRISSGAMLVPRGFTVNEGLLARIKNLSEGALDGRVRVYLESGQVV